MPCELFDLQFNKLCDLLARVQRGCYWRMSMCYYMPKFYWSTNWLPRLHNASECDG